MPAVYGDSAGSLFIGGADDVRQVNANARPGLPFVVDRALDLSRGGHVVLL
jgi:hypothetical protein